MGPTTVSWTDEDSGAPTYGVSYFEHQPVKERSRAKTFQRQKKCGAQHCHSHHGNFRDRHLQEHDLTHGKSMLSVGKHMRLSTGRMVANYLRRHVCPVADDAACPRLTELFNTSLWIKPLFIMEVNASLLLILRTCVREEYLHL